MKKLFLIIAICFGLPSFALQKDTLNNNCYTKVIKSSAYKNGIVKTKNGDLVTNKETIAVEIDPCNHSVLVVLNKKNYDLVLYKTDRNGTIYAATLNGKQIIKINVNQSTNEIETIINDLHFTTYIEMNYTNNQPIAVEE